MCPPLPVGPHQPGVHQHVLRGDPLARLLPQQAFDQALCSGAQGVRQGKLTSPNFGEQSAMFSTMKWVPENKFYYLLLFLSTLDEYPLISILQIFVNYFNSK